MPALGALTCAVALTCCIQTPGFSPPDPSSIDAGEVRRIISVLADDDMRGRRAFTEDAARAAAFLAGEFEAAGLEPLEGTQGYRQHFPVYAIETESSRVIVDGVTLAASQILLRLAEPTLSWSTGDAPLVVVGPGDDPTGVFEEHSLPTERIGADQSRGPCGISILTFGSHQGLIPRNFY